MELSQARPPGRQCRRADLDLDLDLEAPHRQRQSRLLRQLQRRNLRKQRPPPPRPMGRRRPTLLQAPAADNLRKLALLALLRQGPASLQE